VSLVVRCSSDAGFEARRCFCLKGAARLRVVGLLVALPLFAQKRR
jgi:hypothetical protein